MNDINDVDLEDESHKNTILPAVVAKYFAPSVFSGW